MKWKVFKVTPDEKQTLEFQIEVGEVRPGTDPADVAVNHILTNVAHKDYEKGVQPLIYDDAVRLTQWLVLDDHDIYWFIPCKQFRKSPVPVKLEYQELCRLGYCVTKDIHYMAFELEKAHEKIKVGICPQCGGPAKK